MNEVIKAALAPTITVVIGFIITITQLEARFESLEKRAGERYYMQKDMVERLNRLENNNVSLSKDIENFSFHLKIIDSYVPTVVMNNKQRISIVEEQLKN